MTRRKKREKKQQQRAEMREREAEGRGKQLKDVFTGKNWRRVEGKGEELGREEMEKI